MAATGRPPFAWTEEIEAEIFDRIAKGEAVRNICKDDWLPSWSTVNKRLASDAEFSAQYARAREDQADAIFDEILAIADDAHNDWMEINGEDDAGWRANGEHIQRSKLRIDARKWMAGKLRPKKYGDKLELEHGGNVKLTPIINFNAKGD